MAASTRDSINQRIALTGDTEVRRQLEQIGQAGDKAFTKAAGTSKQLGFAVRNLSFQVNDLATSLASGASVMQVFAQQGGQIAQAFQQGGGLGPVLGGIATRLKEMITPMRALAGLGAAAAAGVAVLGARAISADNAIRQFDVTLKALRPPTFLRGDDPLKGLGFGGKELEEAAKRLRSAGLSISEAREEIQAAIRAGVDPKLSEGVIRFGKDLDASFGKGAKSGDAFVKAIEGGPAALRKFGQDVRAIAPGVTELQDGLRTVPELIRAIINAPNIKGAADRALDPLSKQARNINVEFQNILDSMSLFFKEGFVNLVSTGGAALNVFRSLGSAVRELNFTGLSEGFAAAFAPIQGIVTTAITAIRAQLAGPDPLGLIALATAAATNVQQLFATLGQTAMDTLVNAFSSVDPFAFLVTQAQAAVAAITNALQGLLNFARQVGNAVASAFSSAGPEFTAPIPPIPGNAAGGLIRGPGTGTSDSILSRLSNGEFVVNAAATRQNLPLLQALNSLNTSMIPRSRPPRGYAAGGLVGAAAAGGSVAAAHFHFGDGTTGTLRGERSVVRALAKEASAARMLSAGRKPGWSSGRRYGG